MFNEGCFFLIAFFALGFDLSSDQVVTESGQSEIGLIIIAIFFLVIIVNGLSILYRLANSMKTVSAEDIASITKFKKKISKNFKQLLQISFGNSKISLDKKRR